MKTNLTLESLPLYRELSDIAIFIKDHTKGAILGPPGIGKSLGIPGSLSRLNSTHRYHIVVPNISTAKFLALKQRIINPGIIISYADEYHPPQTGSRIVYATSGYIKNVILESPTDIDFTDMLFIDEAHITSVDNYLIVKLWELYLQKNIRIPRLYLLSATLDRGTYGTFDIYQIKSNPKKVDIKYHFKDYPLTSKQRYIDLVDIVVRQQTIDPRGTFIVFAPGKREILTIISLLIKSLDKPGIKILPAYGELPTEEIDKIFEETSDQKIIITTNIFESVITISGVTAVFDTMLEKRISSGERGYLITSFISQSSANQRAGRTGRTTDGVCYRMCTREQFEILNEYRPIDIILTPIYNILIKLITKEFNYEDIISILPIGTAKIAASIKFLKSSGLISESNQITDLGKFYLKFNLTVQSAATLWWMLKSDAVVNKYAGLILVLLINNYKDVYYDYHGEESGNPELSKTQNDLNLFKYKENWSQFKGESDLHTYLNAWLNLINILKTPTVDIRNKIRDWSEKNKFKFKRIYAVYISSLELMKELKNIGLGDSLIPTYYNTNEIVDQMKPILRKVHTREMFTLVDGVYRGVDGSEDRYSFDVRLSVSEYTLGLPRVLLSFVQVKNLNQRTHRILFGLGYSVSDDRIFNPYLKSIPASKKLMDKPLTATYIKYPVTDVRNIKFSLNMTPEIPDQNFVKIGQIFPYDKK